MFYDQQTKFNEHASFSDNFLGGSWLPVFDVSVRGGGSHDPARL